MDEDWFSHPGRNCRGMDPAVFFADNGATNAIAKRVCVGCPVQNECLEYAVADPSLHGMWGGASYMERRVIRKKRGNVSRMARVKNPAKCGSTSGYNRHRLNGEEPCQSCLEARRAYESERKARRSA
jgi:WhiB family redox-sensing transcriptional regulator